MRFPCLGLAPRTALFEICGHNFFSWFEPGTGACGRRGPGGRQAWLRPFSSAGANQPTQGGAHERGLELREIAPRGPGPARPRPAPRSRSILTPRDSRLAKPGNRHSSPLELLPAAPGPLQQSAPLPANRSAPLEPGGPAWHPIREERVGPDRHAQIKLCLAASCFGPPRWLLTAGRQVFSSGTRPADQHGTFVWFYFWRLPQYWVSHREGGDRPLHTKNSPRRLGEGQGGAVGPAGAWGTVRSEQDAARWHRHPRIRGRSPMLFLVHAHQWTGWDELRGAFEPGERGPRGSRRSARHPDHRGTSSCEAGQPVSSRQLLTETGVGRDRYESVHMTSHVCMLFLLFLLRGGTGRWRRGCLIAGGEGAEVAAPTLERGLPRLALVRARAQGRGRPHHSGVWDGPASDRVVWMDP